MEVTQAAEVCQLLNARGLAGLLDPIQDAAHVAWRQAAATTLAQVACLAKITSEINQHDPDQPYRKRPRVLRRSQHLFRKAEHRILYARRTNVETRGELCGPEWRSA